MLLRKLHMLSKDVDIFKSYSMIASTEDSI